MAHKILRPGFKSVHGIVVSEDQHYYKSCKIETIGPKFGFEEDMWQVCQCECGTICVINAVLLRQKSKPILSCGCLKTKHNMRKSTLYKEWRRIKFALPHAESWDDFKKFHEEIVADIGEQPSPDSRIRKIDKNDILRPGNIEWQLKSGSIPKTTKKTSLQPPKEAAKSLCLF